MYFKDQTGGLHFLSAEDIESGRTFDEVDGTLVEGTNRAIALLPAGVVPISDAEAMQLESPPETREQAAARLQAFVQGHMDAAARAAGYDDIKTAVTYADEPAVPLFEAQGKAFRAWRSRVWAACYELFAQAEADQAIPTEAQVLASLPKLELPA